MTEQLLIYIFAFILGAVHGSFFNVVGLRIPKGESIVKPNSHCTVCDRDLKWFELVPVLSWIFLLGKCRTCKTKISPIYLIIEIITGLLFLAVVWKWGVSLHTLFYLILVSLLVVLSVSDVVYRIIPNKFLLFFGIILLPMTFFLKDVTVIEQLIGVALAYVLNLVILLLSKGKGMGGGDIKLFMLLGLLLGYKAFLLIFFLSSFVGLFPAIFVKIKKKTNETPFGPSISVTTLIVIFYGEKIIRWYLSLI